MQPKQVTPLTKAEAIEKWLAAMPAYIKAVQKRAAWDGAYQAALKYAGGLTLNQASSKAIFEFYKVPPIGLRKYTRQCFVAATLQCQWTPDRFQPAVPLPAACRYLPAASQESFRNRTALLLDTDYEDEAFFALRLYRLALFAKQKGVSIDCAQLLHDLISWQNRAYQVKRRWIEATY